MSKQLVRWWKITASLLTDGEASESKQTYYMRSVYSSTATLEAKVAMLSNATEWDQYGAFEVRIDTCEEIQNPPDGALYVMVEFFPEED
jgi:hypothetical protein